MILNVQSKERRMGEGSHSINVQETPEKYSKNHVRLILGKI
jgi:hypothetical protein